MFDAMATAFDEVKIWRDPDCPACGTNASVARPASTDARRSAATTGTPIGVS